MCPLLSHTLIPVAPYTGAWIEILAVNNNDRTADVAPYTGAWIEIPSFMQLFSLVAVAPYTGAWIEMLLLWF